MNVVTSTRIWGVFALSLSDDANLLKKHLPTSFPSKLPIVKSRIPAVVDGEGIPRKRAWSPKASRCKPEGKDMGSSQRFLNQGLMSTQPETPAAPSAFALAFP